MRAPSHAPAVRYVYGRAVLPAWALLIATSCCLASTLAWLTLGAVKDTVAIKAVLGLALWALCSTAAWRCWRGLPVGHLAWDGGQWWIDHGSPGQVPVGARPLVHLDLQSHLLLSAQPPQGRPLWLWLERRSDPLQWGALRRAVYSPAHDRVPESVTAIDAAPTRLDRGVSTKT